tara:strand:+ start:57 stop:515 length:459 start_codon:yes stop_codon:yes gene_type:complete
MAGFYSGQDGQLFINDSNVAAAKVRSWSFTFNQAVLETNSLEDTDRTIIHGMRSYTGSASIYYYQDSSGSGSGQLTTLINEVIKGGTGAGDSVNAESSYVKFKLKIKDGTANGRFIEFTAIPTSISMTSAIGEVMAADISFEAHGAPSGLVL